jgi:hypothetical protein
MTRRSRLTQRRAQNFAEYFRPVAPIFSIRGLAMVLAKIEIQHYRCFERFSLELSDGLTSSICFCTRVTT